MTPWHSIINALVSNVYMSVIVRARVCVCVCFLYW